MFEASQAWARAWALTLSLPIFGLCGCGGTKEATEPAPAQAEGQSSAGDEHAAPGERQVPADDEDKRDPRDVVPVLPIAPP
jgi:hypothetical protein